MSDVPALPPHTHPRTRTQRELDEKIEGGGVDVTPDRKPGEDEGGSGDGAPAAAADAQTPPRPLHPPPPKAPRRPSPP